MARCPGCAEESAPSRRMVPAGLDVVQADIDRPGRSSAGSWPTSTHASSSAERLARCPLVPAVSQHETYMAHSLFEDAVCSARTLTCFIHIVGAWSRESPQNTCTAPVELATDHNSPVRAFITASDTLNGNCVAPVTAVGSTLIVCHAESSCAG
eukprot:7391976-Prymnesium_polylepis.4